mmetsp:Transcript_10662/g.32862  ORF Transcript_10662/g.32862 Transcript_10662/m.32862 type:complete len:488 (+) Transcript_10662:283-1746(+)
MAANPIVANQDGPLPKVSISDDEGAPLVEKSEEDVANAQFTTFAAWHALKGVGGGCFVSSFPLYVSRLAGENPVRAAIFALLAALCDAAGDAIGGAIVTPFADRPDVGRRPLLILGAFAISASLAFLAIFSRSLVALLLGSFLCSFFFASLTVVVCVDCVARGATAGQSVWCYVGIPGAKDDQAPTPLFGEPLFISRVVGVYVAQLACYGVGFVIGSGIGMALALNVSLASCAATGSGLYALAGVVGIAVLPETLDAFSGLEPLGLASQSPSALCAVLWGGKADVERRSYVASYLFNAAAISCTPPLMVYFLLWRFDLNHIIYFELVASVAAALIVGFLSYWFYLRERFGGCRCMFWGLGVLAIGFAGVGVAFELKMLFAALPLCVLTSPTLLQYLFIHGVVAPEKQGRLAAAIQIASGICVASGLALGYGLWLGLKTDDEHGSRGTRRDFAGASSFFATAGLFLLAAYAILPACALERERRATGMD